MWHSTSGQALTPALRNNGRALFTIEGQRVLTLGDHAARLWSLVEAGGSRPPLMHDGRPVHTAAFVESGDELVTLTVDGMLRLWNRAGLAPARVQQLGPVHGASFMRDGRETLVWDKNSVSIWNNQRGQRRFFVKPEGGVRGAILSPDERRLLTWGDGNAISLWDVASGKSVGQLRHASSILGAAFSPDGSMLLGWTDSGLTQLWDPLSLHPLSSAVPLPIRGAAFPHKGAQILIWDVKGILYSWDTAKQEARHLSSQPDSRTLGAVYSPDDSRVLIWSNNGTATIRDNRTGDLSRLLQHPQIRGALFHPSGSWVLTWSTDGTARIWDTNQGRPVTADLRHDRNKAVNGAALTQEQIMTWSDDGTARLWRLPTDSTLPERHLLDHEVRTGSRLDKGDLKMLSWMEWIERQRRYEEPSSE